MFHNIVNNITSTIITGFNTTLNLINNILPVEKYYNI